MATKNWDVTDIPDLTGKTIIVTGGNSGLGFEAVEALSSKGAEVILACRSTKKGKLAKNKITETQPNSNITVMELDLADLKSIRNFVELFKQKHTQLDILINNAGIMMVPYGLTKDGFENQIGTNHLGHFALTGLLLDELKNTPKSRVVSVTSMAHKAGSMDFNNLLFNKGVGYTPFKAYGRSKLCNLLLTYELQRFFETNKIDSSALVAHPGVSDTNLFVHTAPKWLMTALRPLFTRLVQPANMGVLPELRAATDPTAKGADFFGPNGKREIKGFPVLVQSAKQANSTEDAKKLWEASEKLTGVIYQ